MKRIFIILSIVFISFTLNQHKKVNASTITNIYAFSAEYSSGFLYLLSPFDTSLGELNEVNVSIRGYSLAFTLNPTFPNLTQPSGLVSVDHQFTTPGNVMFDFSTRASIQTLGSFVHPVDLLYYTNLDLSFSFSPNFSQIATPTGYTVPPTINGSLEGFKDTEQFLPPWMVFQQFVNYNPAYVNPSSQLFMQIDYVYTPDGPAIIDPIGRIQLDPVANSLFPNITSVQEITDDQLYALAIAAVPEPSTILLFCLGLLGITGISRKKE